jgi:hypothetical protein
MRSGFMLSNRTSTWPEGKSDCTRVRTELSSLILLMAPSRIVRAFRNGVPFAAARVSDSMANGLTERGDSTSSLVIIGTAGFRACPCCAIHNETKNNREISALATSNVRLMVFLLMSWNESKGPDSARISSRLSPINSSNLTYRRLCNLREKTSTSSV